MHFHNFDVWTLWEYSGQIWNSKVCHWWPQGLHRSFNVVVWNKINIVGWMLDVMEMVEILKRLKRQNYTIFCITVRPFKCILSAAPLINAEWFGLHYTVRTASSPVAQSCLNDDDNDVVALSAAPCGLAAGTGDARKENPSDLLLQTAALCVQAPHMHAYECPCK